MEIILDFHLSNRTNK